MALIPVPETPLPIVWQNTVVDLEPSSRYGPEGTPDTASVNTTMVLVNPHPEPQEISFLAPGHYEAEASARELGTEQGQRAEAIPQDDPRFGELVGVLQGLQEQLAADAARVQALLDKVRQFHRFTLELGPGNRVVRFFTRLPVIREQDGTYKFSEVVPAQFTQLVTHGDFSVVVLLPRAAQGYDQPPTYNVVLKEWSTEVTTQVFGDPNNPSLPALAGRAAVTWYWRQDPVLFVRYEYAG